MSSAIVIARIWLVRLGFMLGARLPMRPTVLLATSHAGRIGGNLAAIRAELARRSPAISTTVLAHRPGAGALARLAAMGHAVLAGFWLARSRLVVVDDYYFPLYAIRPRPGMTAVQVWHASGAFKKMGYSLEGKSFGADAAVLRRVTIHSNYDLCLVSAQRFAPHYAEAFRLPLDRFTARLGIPRTDPLVDPSWRARSAERVRRRYAIPPDTRVVLYAPTFRGNRVTAARHAQALDFAELQRRLGEDHIVLVRAHPFVRNPVPLDPSLRGFVVDASGHADIHELMAASDVLVTDYSSAMYEYSVFGRPIAFFAPDHAEYERERGFYLDFPSDLPGPVFERTEPLAEYLAAGVFDIARVQRFRDASFDVLDGRATARFVDEVVLPALAGLDARLPAVR